MAADPKISVIIPVYNVERYVARCLVSVLGQTYTNIEVIIVDDGSTDGSGEIVDRYAQRDSRVRLIRQANAGLGRARNVAFPFCTGEYIAFVDSDDYLDADCLAFLYKTLRAHHADIAVCGYRYEQADGRILPPQKPFEKAKVLSGLEAAKGALYWNHFGVAPWAKLYAASLWADKRFAEDVPHEDLAVTYRVYLQADRVAYVNMPKMTYFLRQDSMLRRPFDVSKMSVIDISEAILRYAAEREPALVSAATSRMVASCFFVLLQMPGDLYRKEKERLWGILCKYRGHVARDRESRRKTRVAALLSYAGFPAVQAVFALMKKLSPVF